MIWRSDWLAELPENFTADYTKYLLDHLDEFSEALVNSDQRIHDRLEHTAFGRMQMCQLNIVPWLNETIELSSANALEIGAGQGSLTAPLILAGANVTALDIDEAFLEALKVRTRMMGVQEPTCILAEPDWAVECPKHILTSIQQADVIIMYALLEHMMPVERVRLLQTLKKCCSPHCKIAIMEAPNRLAPWDWHTSLLAFADIVPDQLYQEVLLKSPKASVANTLGAPTSRMADVDEVGLYRSGRGVSFHEFDAAVGIENIDVLSDGYHEYIRRTRDRFNKPSAKFEEALIEIFQAQTPPIPAAFARPSIDLIFRFR